MSSKRAFKRLSCLLLAVCFLVPLFSFSPALAAAETPTDAEIVGQFIVDDQHHGEYCTEDAQTVREFGAGTNYGPIMTYGVEDPLFENGGFLFMPTDRSKVKLYAIAVDFTDCVGDMQIPYGRHRNVVKSAYGGTIFDFSDPQIHFQQQFLGTAGLIENPKFEWLGTDAQRRKGIKQILEEQSMGKMDVEIELLNERLAVALDIDTDVERAPWFHIDGPIFSYSSAGPADSEDYRVFARLYQASIYAAVEQLEALGLNDSVVGQGSNVEDIDFLYIITPFNAFGYRLGFQGGGGIMASYSFNSQVLMHRDSEYRHVPGVLTPGGRMVGSGVFGMKGIVNPGNASISPNPANALHELTHGLGMFDDYSYGGIANNVGEAAASGTGNWGVMGSNMSSVSPDYPVWRKFRLGWLEDDEIKVILPGDAPQDIYIRALGSYDGDGGSYVDDPTIKTRMVVLPKEYRTRDTFGLQGVWDNGWNPFRMGYNWFDWFVNVWIGGESNALKSFPTFYTLESRKALGADGRPYGAYTGLPATRAGLVIDYIANPTWETGHGAGGFKVMTGDNGLKTNAVWVDPNIGLTVTVLENGVFYDKVRVEYTGAATNGAKHVYQGLLTATDSHVTNSAGDEFSVDFSLTTLGTPAPNDSTNAPATLAAIRRVATPLGVPGGIAGFKMEVTFDPDAFVFVSAGDAPFAYTVDAANAAAGKLLVTGTGTQMIDKDVILSLNFKTRAGVIDGAYTIGAAITDVTLINWRNETLVKGAPGFEGVGTFGNGTLGALYNATASNVLTSEDIKSTGGKVTVSGVTKYTISGRIVCDTKGPVAGKDIDVFGTWIGVETAVTLYNSGGTAVASTKSDWDGNYKLIGVPAGIGYYLKFTKAKYSDLQTAAFSVAGNITGKNAQIKRALYPISGTVYGAVNSDGSGRTPLAGVDVYVLGIGSGYSLLGGPATTDAEGRYTVYSKTDSTDKNFAGVAVKVAGAAAKYGKQLTLFAKDDLTGLQEGDLDLHMGTQPHLILDDWVYPANNVRLGVDGTFAFYLGGPGFEVVTGRDVTLTETQEVHIRPVTKSADIYYQLRKLSDGSAVGPRLKSVGTTNGDDVIRNIPKGQYYIELTREGYVSLNTMPFTVDTTRVMLRDGQTSNTMEMNTRLGAAVVSGKVIDSKTGFPLSGASIVFQSWTNVGGMGNPVLSAADGTFRYDVVTEDKDIIISMDGFVTQNINMASGGASNLVVALDPVPGNVLAYVGAVEETYCGDPIDYTVTLDNVNKVGTVKVSFTVDTANQALNLATAVTPLNGFETLTLTWKELGGGVWQGTALLMHPGFITTADPIDALKITTTAKNTVAGVTIEISDMEATGSLDGLSAFLQTTILRGQAGTSIVEKQPIYSKFDLNHDGKIDILDTNIAVFFYLKSSSSAGWATDKFDIATAQDADVNDSGRVDLADLIEIMANYRDSYDLFPY